MTDETDAATKPLSSTVLNCLRRTTMTAGLNIHRLSGVITCALAGRGIPLRAMNARLPAAALAKNDRRVDFMAKSFRFENKTEMNPSGL